jgi:hypothetical protein
MATKPAEHVYILRFHLPAGLNVESRKERGKFSENIRYRFEVDLRRKIRKMRRHYRHLAFRYSIPFYGLRLVREEDLNAVQGFAKTASEEFAKLRKDLKVQVVPIPIDLNAKGAIQEAIADAVKSHIYGKVLARLKKLAKKGKELPEASRKALLDLTERLEGWNLLGSKDVSDKLAEMAKEFSRAVVVPAAEDLEEEVAKLSSEGVWVEL